MQNSAALSLPCVPLMSQSEHFSGVRGIGLLGHAVDCIYFNQILWIAKKKVVLKAEEPELCLLLKGKFTVCLC